MNDLGVPPTLGNRLVFFEVIVLRHDYALRTPFSVWQYLFSFMILAQNRCIHLQYTKVYLDWISLASASSDVFRSKFRGHTACRRSSRANLKIMWWSQCHRHSPTTVVIFSLWPLFWLGNGKPSMALIPKKPGWWCNNHLEKYESQWEGWHPIYIYMKWKIIQPCLKPPTRNNRRQISSFTTSICSMNSQQPTKFRTRSWE